jgi:circadian clock protein KaiB
MNGQRSRRKPNTKSSPFIFHIYIAGRTVKSERALARLKQMCNEWCPGQFEIRVVDVASRPDLAQAHEVIAIPTILRSLPTPVQRTIGDLSHKQKALLGLTYSRLLSWIHSLASKAPEAKKRSYEIWPDLLKAGVLNSCSSFATDYLLRATLRPELSCSFWTHAAISSSIVLISRAK